MNAVVAVITCWSLGASFQGSFPTKNVTVLQHCGQTLCCMNHHKKNFSPSARVVRSAPTCGLFDVDYSQNSQKKNWTIGSHHVTRVFCR
ncbi:hypothetical protein B0T21DRAFT_355329 [Apiosordaria backusii]|uniref:Secreted protein n=1 Tax=Apiosordaria backusii TaxID=314023 RepID=A0AA40K6K6_9PEZI|nr:hypothetical protein B0T21DRAFT_355329 [Apiosordaria backusii]